MVLSGSMSWRPSAAKSNMATPRPSWPLACRGTRCPSPACRAAAPRRIAAPSAGGQIAAWAARLT
eukprot:6454934-Alexandrium_andersonii.AAC.1